MISYATRAEGFSYSLCLFAFMFTVGTFLCFTVIGAFVGIPMIVIGLWALVTSPWAYKKLRAGPCPVCAARCVFPPKVRVRKCPDCKTRLIIRSEELCKVEA
jgi:hypothetical protein